MKEHVDSGAEILELRQFNARPFSDRLQVAHWRHWMTGPFLEIGDAVLVGAFDDVLEFEDGRVAPWDFKTRGSAPQGDSLKYYGLQLDVYELLLSEGLGLLTTGTGYLTYLWPQDVTGGRIVHFNLETEPLLVNKERARLKVIEAMGVLQGDLPSASSSCAYCRYTLALKDVA